jgi:hypothetical protein
MAERIVLAISLMGSIVLLRRNFLRVCHLILNSAPSQDHLTSLVQVQNLCFQEAQLRLRYGTNELSWLKDMLNRDYRAVTGLMNHAENTEARMERCIHNYRAGRPGRIM